MTPTKSPPRIVANPKFEGIGHAARRGLSGTDPTAAPAIAPIATPSLPTARAFAS